MNIAIADDHPDDRKMAEEQLRRYLTQAHPEIMKDLVLETYSCAEDLLASFSPGQYDLLLLDIYMEDMTGMEAAEAIRLRDERVPIMFLTSSQEHILDGYRVFAAGYLLKPLTAHLSEFAKAMDHVFPEIMASQRTVLIPFSGKDVEVPVRNIMYVDINAQHKLSIHLPDMVADTVLSYNQCQEMLTKDNRFIECHYRIILNMDYVWRMGQDDFVLKDGSKVPISTRRKKDVKAAYMHYMAHR